MNIPEEFVQNNSRIMQSPVSSKNRYLDRILFFLWMIIKVIRFRRGEFTIIYSFQEPTSLLVGYLMKILKKGKYWVIDFLDDPSLSLKDRRKMEGGIKEIIIINFLKILDLINKFILRQSDLQIVQGIKVTDSLPSLLHQEYKISLESMVLVPNGIDLNLTFPRKTSKINSKDFNILYIGTVDINRGLSLMIQIVDCLMRNIPNIKLTLVGPADNAQLSYLKHIVKEKRLEGKVEYLGICPSEKVWSLIETANVCIYPFQYKHLNYTFPIKVFEYLALGKPVVAANFEGIRYIIKHEFNGLLVDPNDQNAWVEAILRLYKDVDLYQRLVAFARSSIQSFDWKVINGKVTRALVNLATKNQLVEE